VAGLAILAVGLIAVPAHGQRVQFPAPIGGDVSGSGTTAASNAAPRSSTELAQVPANGSQIAVQSGSAYATAATVPMSPSPAAGPSYAPAAPAGQVFGPAPATGPAPAAANGGVLPPPNWDPYAAPGSAPPPALFQQEPAIPSPCLPGQPEITFEGMQRFLKELHVDYTWMAGNGGSQFGYNDIELASTFAIPLINPQTPLLVTPGFAAYFLNGPVVPPADPATAMPGHVFDAYLDTAWHPQLTPWLGADLAFRIGVYSDFTEVTSESIRYTGNALAVLTLTPSIQLKAGVVYLDRVRVTMLPSGGLIWTPNQDVRFEILFPNPRIMKRLATVGTTDWWLYARGEYGGDSWTVKASDGNIDRVDYNDERVAVGVDFDQHHGLTGLFEVGVAFDREILFDTGSTFRPTTTVFLRAAFGF
jgi:hypothetical protein